MTISTSPKCILACIDRSDLGHAVIEHALWLAKTSGLPLKFLHTIEHSHISEQVHREGTITPNMSEHLLDELSEEERVKSKQLIADGKTILKVAMEKALQAGLTDVIAKQRHGRLSETLQDLDTEFDLVVLGCNGEDHKHDKKGLGSQLEDSIRALHSAVFIVKGDFVTPRQILFAYNGSPTSKKALEVIAQAPFFDEQLTVHVISVQKTVEQANMLVNEAKLALENNSMTLITKALTGDPREQILSYQQQQRCDIIAMGAFSHGKLHGFFFGSFTTKMLLENNSHFLLIR